MQKHKGELVKKSGMKLTDFNKLLELILKKVLIVPSSTLYEHREEALKIVKGIDINDVIFIACSLANPDSILWSDDRKLKKQSKVKVLNTDEIRKIL